MKPLFIPFPPDTRLDRLAAIATTAVTPRVAKGYGPGQKSHRAPLESPHHFSTMAALRQRSEDLANYRLAPDLEAVRRLWGATYTQAIYTRDTTAGLRTLLEQIELLERALDVVAQRLVKKLDATDAAALRVASDTAIAKAKTARMVAAMAPVPVLKKAKKAKKKGAK